MSKFDELFWNIIEKKFSRGIKKFKLKEKSENV